MGSAAARAEPVTGARLSPSSAGAGGGSTATKEERFGVPGAVPLPIQAAVRSSVPSDLAAGGTLSAHSFASIPQGNFTR